MPACAGMTGKHTWSKAEKEDPRGGALFVIAVAFALNIPTC